MTQTLLKTELLSARERARLVIKDNHEKHFLKKGFLTDTEIDSLTTFKEPATAKEYRKYWNLYQKRPIIIGLANETYLRFKYLYSYLERAHLLISLYPSIKYLAEVITAEVKDGEKRENALLMTDLLQGKAAPETYKKLTGDENFSRRTPTVILRKMTPQVYKQACYCYAVKRLIDKINKELSFNVFTGGNCEKIYQDYIPDIELSIKQHNRIIQKYKNELEDELNSYIFEPPIYELNSYIIPKPTYKTPFYKEWEDYLFKDKPRDE